MNWKKKQSHAAKQAVMYSYFPAARAEHVGHFGFTVQAQQPCLSVPTPSSLSLSHGKAATRIWACRKTSLKGSCLQLHFQQPF